MPVLRRSTTPTTTPAPPPVTRRELSRRVRSWGWRARPWLVGALVALAVMVGTAVLAPEDPPTLEVVTVTRSASAGEAITADLLQTVALPLAAVPAGAITDPGAITGARLSALIPRGAVLTQAHLATDGWELSPGEVALPVRFADPGTASLAPEGTRLWLIRATGDGAEVLSRTARVLARIGTDDGGAGLLGAGGTQAGDLTVVAVAREAVERVSDASAAGVLTLAIGARDPGDA